MSKNTSVYLNPHFENFVNEQLDSGRYNNVSELIRAGLRLLEEENIKYKSLNLALEEGEKSGLNESFDSDKLLNKMHKKYVK
jgi:antitoxin ParD1/3/4|tara:strand:- start:1340 stop:1585 length:246 start_codon:yes stop_codon:yes gene_type:complete